MAHSVRLVAKVPDPLLKKAIDALPALAFPNVEYRSAIFPGTRTIHLRIHDWKEPRIPSFKDLCSTVDCRDTGQVHLVDPIFMELANWIRVCVKGQHLGRVFIVGLGPNQHVKEHTDPGLYFKAHKRFHVPLQTNEQVVFYGPNKSDPTHLNVGSLYQLDNLRAHSVENNGSDVRIHLIVDVRTT